MSSRSGFPEDIRTLSFEEAMAELEEIVRALEEGETGLDASIAAYERGAMLRRYCEGKLKDAETRIEKIVSGDDDTVRVQALETDTE